MKATKRERVFSFEEVMTFILWVKRAQSTEDRDVIELLASLSHEQYSQLYDVYENAKRK